jgi:hypothetical protein
MVSRPVKKEGRKEVWAEVQCVSLAKVWVACYGVQEQITQTQLPLEHWGTFKLLRMLVLCF